MKQGKKSHNQNSPDLFDSYDSKNQNNTINQGSDNKQGDTLSLPKGWEIKKLAEVVEILDNLRKPITKRDRIEGEYPYYGATGILSYVHNYIFSEKLVLIGEDGAKWASGDNTSFIAEGKYWVNNHAHVIRPNRKIILDEWIVYFLNLSDLTPFITGMTVPKLNQEKMRSIPIPLPPLSEQKRIVSILDECFAAIAKAKANAEQNLHNAKELFESYLQGVFENGNWEKKKLSEVAKHSLGKMLDKNKNKGEPKEYLRNQNVRWFEFDLSDLNEMPFLENEKEKYTAIKGDVMICEGGYPGRAAIWEEDYPIYFQKAIHRVRFHNEEYNKWFLFYLFILDKTGKLKNHFTGTGIQHFTGDALGKLILPFPPLNKVNTIVRQLDALRAETQKLAAVYQQKIDDLEELKKSILQKAFAGEL